MDLYQDGTKKEFTVVHLFAGIGGAALGFQQAREEYKGLVGRFRTLVGIDVDPEACADFEALTGAPAVEMDLFARSDYEAFHGSKPPDDWREATAEDILAATGGECPDVVFLSPPCKGFSGLLPNKKAVTPKYQALNNLVIRGLKLTLEAFSGDLPACIMLENVPRITSRGADLLRQVKRLLKNAGYEIHPKKDQDGYHDCGEIGGLGQRRKRYLLIARLTEKMNAFIYQPPKRRVKSIGEIIGPLPLPDDAAAGPMHRLPRLKWLTWVRLALIPAGGDWRDLETLDGKGWHKNAYRIIPWWEPAGTVTSGGAPSCGAVTVADPRLEYSPRGAGSYGVQEWDKPGATVVGSAYIKGSNPVAVADPRLKHTPREGVYQVQDWDSPSTTVTGAARVNKSNGAACVADPRLPRRDNRHPAVYQVVKWDEASPCVTGTRFGSGAPAIADPRLPKNDVRYHNKYQLHDWDQPAATVTGIADIQAGAQSIADPRMGLNKNAHHALCRVCDWDDPANTVTGATRPAGGAISVADPRLNPREDRRSNSHSVRPWDGPAHTITGEDTIGSGAQSVADPRLGCKPRGNTKGPLGVQSWDETSSTVFGSMDVHSGPAAVADPRIPSDNDRPDPPPVIIALDGTWHRPLTTLELAVLQGFPVTMPDGRPLSLTGRSDSRWRERIGNAVPPPAAQAIAEQILFALMVSAKGEWALGSTEIWVTPNRKEILRDTFQA